MGRGDAPNSVCDSVPHVALPRQVFLAFALLFAPSGCLLDTGPINRPPVVKIVDNPQPIYRNGPPVDFSADVTDEDGPSSLQTRWVVVPPENGSCSWTARADAAARGVVPRAADATYSLTASSSLDPVCLCAQAIDHFGAKGQNCLEIQAINRAPTVNITDASGATTDDLRPLYSNIHLIADASDPDGDVPQISWQLQFSGSDSAGKSITLAPCAGVAGDANRCFTANTPGDYNVTVKVTDSSGATGSDSFIVHVNHDTPPCIERTDPDVRAQMIVVSRATDLGGAYESRSFQVLNVADDGQPFPVPADSMQRPTQFIWSVFDPKSASPVWVRQTITSSTFILSQSMFPDALPGDTVRLRLEVQDSVNQRAVVDCPGDPDICCANNTCGGDNECIRSTTWTVLFQP